jgi:hypothetical protein
MSLLDKRLGRLEAITPTSLVEREGPLAAYTIGELLIDMSIDELKAAQSICRAHPDALEDELHGLHELLDTVRDRLAAEQGRKTDV